MDFSKEVWFSPGGSVIIRATQCSFTIFPLQKHWRYGCLVTQLYAIFLPIVWDLCMQYLTLADQYCPAQPHHQLEVWLDSRATQGLLNIGKSGLTYYHNLVFKIPLWESPASHPQRTLLELGNFETWTRHTKKSRIRETLNLSTNAHSSIVALIIFFPLAKNSKNAKNAKNA